MISCAGAEVRVGGGTESDRRSACEGIRDAARLLGGLGLAVAGTVEARIVERVESSIGAQLLGSYDVARRQMLLLGLEALRATWVVRGVAGVPMSPRLHRSFAAHEMAHAIANDNFAPKAPRLCASEYIAAVVQLATLPAPERELLLRHNPRLTPYRHEREISAVMYFIDPWAFAVKSFRHFEAVEDRAALLRRLLAKGCMTDQMRQG
ncbi:MAG: hypothetical protein JSW68_06355 [Burkholderiales bacterium]|nr:MAG: hypothetical protein JSW68_06355 [Burkholderiales bacterium]